jgi:hypothetical protein
VFENIATASAPAQIVTVHDVLDPTIFDLATFSFATVTVADTSITPPVGLREFGVDVDFLSRRGVYVRIREKLDPTTGDMTCTFTSVDTTTWDVPEDIGRGFLPPDVNVPEGEGGIAFRVDLRGDILDGTSIPNHASIVFDQNPAIDTPEWRNTIDGAKPSSHALPLAPEQTTERFRIDWTGTDVGSDIKNFDVFVSEDGGPFFAWLDMTPALADTFHGVPGSTYRFYSLARDSVGNLEDIPAAADDSTTINPLVGVESPQLQCEAMPMSVRLMWRRTTAADRVHIYRRRSNEEWSLIASLALSDPEGTNSYLDTTMPEPGRYAYRVSWGDTGQSLEAWVTIPPLIPFALESMHPNPSSSALAHLSLPTRDPAQLDVFDVAGRQVVHMEVGSLGPGTHAVSLRDHGLVTPGVYLIRLTQGKNQATIRGVFVR